MKDLKSSYSESGKFVYGNGLQFMDLNLNPEKLKPNPENPYKELPKGDYERLKKDIGERGIIDPLIVDETLTLLTGHNRLKIALELGLKEIPVRKLSSELSDKQKERLMILDNLNRRQLSPKEKKAFIKKVYGELIEKDNRGGDRKSKVQDYTFDKPINVAEKISKETGISERTAKGIIADIRREKKSKVQDYTFDKPKQETTVIKKLRKEIAELERTLKAKKSELSKLLGKH